MDSRTPRLRQCWGSRSLLCSGTGERRVRGFTTGLVQPRRPVRRRLRQIPSRSERGEGHVCFDNSYHCIRGSSRKPVPRDLRLSEVCHSGTAFVRGRRSRRLEPTVEIEFIRTRNLRNIQAWGLRCRTFLLRPRLKRIKDGASLRAATKSGRPSPSRSPLAIPYIAPFPSPNGCATKFLPVPSL